MRYAHTKNDADWIGVEPLHRAGLGAGPGVMICDFGCDFGHQKEITIKDREQLVGLIELLRHAAIINGWGEV